LKGFNKIPKEDLRGTITIITVEEAVAEIIEVRDEERQTSPNKRAMRPIIRPT